MSSETDSLLPTRRPLREDDASSSGNPEQSTGSFSRAYGTKIAIATLSALVLLVIGLHTLPAEQKDIQEAKATDFAVFTGS